MITLIFSCWTGSVWLIHSSIHTISHLKDIFIIMLWMSSRFCHRLHFWAALHRYCWPASQRGGAAVFPWSAWISANCVLYRSPNGIQSINKYYPLTKLMSLWQNHHHRSKSLDHAASDMLHLIFGTSFLHDSGFLVQIIHAAACIWTCRFNLLHTAIIFHHFFTRSSKLKPNCSENLILHLSPFLSVGLISLL